MAQHLPEASRSELAGQKPIGKSIHSFRLGPAQNAGGADLPTEEESSGTAASPSIARRGRPASVEEDEDAESAPCHPSQIDGDGDIDDEGRACTEPMVPALADVDEAVPTEGPDISALQRSWQAQTQATLQIQGFCSTLPQDSGETLVP